MLYYPGLIADERDYKITSPQCKRVHGLWTTARRKNTELSGPCSVKKLDDRARAEDIFGLLDRIAACCGYRNEVIHSLMNKNLDSLYAGLAEKAEEGHQLFRRLDNHVSWVKRKKIRETMGI